MMDNRQEIVNWCTNLIKNLLEKPEEISVKATVDEKGLLLIVFATKNELGQLIGKQGRNAEALRTVISIYGIRHGARVGLKIQDAVNPRT
jgi:predicted RNA-binding protein YlqC (UPF0109 family)